MSGPAALVAALDVAGAVGVGAAATGATTAGLGFTATGGGSAAGGDINSVHAKYPPTPSTSSAAALASSTFFFKAGGCFATTGAGRAFGDASAGTAMRGIGSAL